MVRFAPVLIALPLAACGGEAPPTAEDAAVEVEAPAETATLDLEADGIVVPAQGGAEQLEVPFGTMRAAAETTLESVLGSALSRGSNAECGAGPVDVTEYDGMTLNFQEDRLVGYYATAPYVPELTRAEMLADPAVAPVEGSTLGAEFTIGVPEVSVISGLFAGEEDAAGVEALWAGTNCIFR